MKKVYLDTNIFIDILTDRKLESISIDEIKPLLENSLVYMSTLSVHIAYYALKIKPDSDIETKTRNLLDLINLTPLDTEIVNRALNSFKTDFEDTLQYYSALSEECDYILTRDIKDFREIKKETPSEVEIITNLENVD